MVKVYLDCVILHLIFCLLLLKGPIGANMHDDGDYTPPNERVGMHGGPQVVE